MIVLATNSTGIATGYLAGRFPGTLGHLFSPGGQRGPWPFMPYALDNGAYGAFLAGKDRPKMSTETRAEMMLALERLGLELVPGSEPIYVGEHESPDELKGLARAPVAWRHLLEWAKASLQAPRWVLVPDVVGDRLETLRLWDIHAPTAAAYGWPLAFAVQDGMAPSDVPGDASVIFVGGSTEWKRTTMAMWCRHFPRVHVGRINTYRWLRVCEDAGAESVDGTGWFRGDREQLRGLEQWCAESSGLRPRENQTSLCFDDSADETGPGSKSSATAAPAPAGAAHFSTTEGIA